MEITEDILLDELFPAEDDLLSEAWPLPAAETAKEFALYLEEIGVRL